MTINLTNSQSRLFIKRKNDKSFTYHNNVSLESIADSVKTYELLKVRNGSLQPIGYILDENGELTVSVRSYIPKNRKSILHALYKEGCPVSLTLLFGECINPTNKGEFDKSYIVENGVITEYSTNAMSVLSGANEAMVEETVTITSLQLNERVRLKTNKTVLASESGIVDIAVLEGCKNCKSCSNVIALQIDTGSFNVLYSNDFVTWIGSTINIAPNGIPIIGSHNIVSDSKNIYATVEGTTNSYLAIGNIESVQDGNAEFNTIELSITNISDLAINDDYIFISSFDGDVIRLSKDSLLEEQLDMLAQVNTSITSLSTSGNEHLYVGGTQGLFNRYNSFSDTLYNRRLGNITPEYIDASNDELILLGAANKLFIVKNGEFETVDFSFGCINGVHRYTDNIWYVTSTTNIYRTIDGGETWSVEEHFGVVASELCRANGILYVVDSPDFTIDCGKEVASVSTFVTSPILQVE